ncbi:ABC transporter permease [Bradyrhizobium sp. LHD-71]|uniref:ABC transporter permease n=1 Tax=Bradyrhizobium sp. LHD-71 TaxID=3072141 RepID=UPI00280DF587|nr:ABC transporter permease [Bradyrhizobium sp. LHD-71]MDQ8732345.1 ABC transporter permease [Bradyrhizobium sp. LHD-71]
MSLVLTTAVRRAAWAGLPAPALVAAAAVLALAVIGAAAPMIAPYDPLDQDLLALNQMPDAVHWLGTDHIGRDVLSRLVMGTRTTLLVGVGGAAAAFAIGAGLGLLALALGRIVEGLVFGAIDVVRAMPGVLLALLLIVALGAGVVPVTIALGISFAPFFAHVARAAYQREMAQDYVTAARMFGGGPLHVLSLHVAPNLVGVLVTQAAIILPRCIVTESVLSFLGLGASPDAPTWGRMVADASRYIEVAPHTILAPVLAIIVLTASLSLLGDHVRQRLDPLRHVRRQSPVEEPTS